MIDRHTGVVRTVMIEDDPRIAALHREYLEAMDGFRLVAHATTLAQAATLLAREEPDLVLLDVRLPDGNGLDLLRAVRRARPEAFDVVMTTAIADRAHVESAVHLGIVDYLVKPFTAQEFTRRLRAYRAEALRRARATSASGALTQREVDALRGVADTVMLPKGLTEATLARVEGVLAQGEARTAAEICAEAGISRVSARRYLEHLVTQGVADSRPRYGGTGRPSTEYLLRRE